MYSPVGARGKKGELRRLWGEVRGGRYSSQGDEN